jgi:Protein of unknown function (DUF3606)
MPFDIQRQREVLTMNAKPKKLSTWERTHVDVSKPTEVVGWCNKWGVTEARLKAAVTEVGTSVVDVARALGKPAGR